MAKTSKLALSSTQRIVADPRAGNYAPKTHIPLLLFEQAPSRTHHCQTAPSGLFPHPPGNTQFNRFYRFPSLP